MLYKIIKIFIYQYFLFLRAKINIIKDKKIKLIKTKIKNKKIYLLNFTSIGSSIISSCYLNRLLDEKKT